MALAVLHAGVHQPPPNKAGPVLKVPAALVPLKPGATDHAVPAKTPFKNLLDQLTQAVKGSLDQAQDKEKALKAPKAKSDTPVSAEKPKEAKRGDAKDIKADAYEASLVSLMAHQPKVEAVKVKAPEAEAGQGGLEKTKANLRDKRTGAELGVPAAVTAASAEIARAQAQQNAPRAERSEERQRVFVVDKRTETKEKEKLKLPGAEAPAQQPVNGAELQAQQAKVNDAKTAAAEVQVSFQNVAGKPKDAFDLKPQNTPVSPRDAVSFQQYLVEKGYGQLVDQARIVLKDQNAGEIRMTLYPESLGKVKVALNLSDNSLAGQIYVENQTVKEVFQSNMDGLLQAFRDGGWDQMSLEVSVGNGNGGSQAGEHQPQTAAQARDYGRQVTQTAPEVRERIGSWNDRQINLTA